MVLRSILQPKFNSVMLQNVFMCLKFKKSYGM